MHSCRACAPSYRTSPLCDSRLRLSPCILCDCNVSTVTTALKISLPPRPWRCACHVGHCSAVCATSPPRLWRCACHFDHCSAAVLNPRRQPICELHTPQRRCGVASSSSLAALRVLLSPCGAVCAAFLTTLGSPASPSSLGDIDGNSAAVLPSVPPSALLIALAITATRTSLSPSTLLTVN